MSNDITIRKSEKEINVYLNNIISFYCKNVQLTISFNYSEKKLGIII